MKHIEYKIVKENAENLGAVVEGGMNWTWATWPMDDENAEKKATEFEKWAVEVGLETRGVYPPRRDEGWAVRFR